MPIILISCQVIMPDITKLGYVGINPFAPEMECEAAAVEP